ncbi:hypothetical protein GCM10029963_35640 [Micromonospora andamanensis]
MRVGGVTGGTEDLGGGAQVKPDHLVDGEDGDPMWSHGPIIAQGGLPATRRAGASRRTLAW